MDEIQQAREYGDAQRAEGRAEGEAKGRTAAIVAILAARGMAVDDATRVRLTTCTDITLLDRWISRAATVVSLAGVLER